MRHELADFIKEFEQWTTELKVHTAGSGPIEQATSVMVTAADNTCSVELILIPIYVFILAL